MSKIQDALAKARRASPSESRDRADETHGERRHAARSPVTDGTGTFLTIQGRGQFSPISEEIADKHRIIISPRYEQAKTSYKILRTRVLQRMRGNKWNRLAVTACGPAEGKTVTSINLAISLARQENQNVVLIDLDLVRPTVCRYLGIEPSVGIDDYLYGKATSDEVCTTIGIDGLLVLASTAPVENSSETLRSAKMLELLDRVAARNSSSIIIFDMPPLLRSDDVLAFGPFADALLMVVSPGRTSRADLEKATELLHEFELIGTVLNMSGEPADVYY